METAFKCSSAFCISLKLGEPVFLQQRFRQESMLGNCYLFSLLVLGLGFWGFFFGTSAKRALQPFFTTFGLNKIGWWGGAER